MAVDEVTTGTWFGNNATGEIAHMVLGPADTAGQRVRSDLWLRPGSAVAGAHVHDHLVERFEVVHGVVTFRVGSTERRVGPGDGAVEIPSGVVHDWWNSSEETARVRVEVEAVRGGLGRPASRFVAMIEVLWSLGTLGRVNAEGLPDLLWLAAIGREYRDVIRFVQPPAFVQTALFPPLAALARRTGRDPLASQFHGMKAACVIDDPSEESLSALLGQAVGDAGVRLPEEVPA